jgi:hypothetical protein
VKAQLIFEYEAEQMFDEYLDDANEPINIGFGTFYASEILKRCDNVAYRMGVSEFIDHLAENADIYVKGYTDDQMPKDEDEEE